MTVMSGWQTLRAMQELDQRNTRGLDTATRPTRNEIMSKNLITRNVTVAVAGLVIALGLAAAGPASASVGNCNVDNTPTSLVQPTYRSDRTFDASSAHCQPAHRTTLRTFAAAKNAVPDTNRSTGKLL
jgi:hypothetical protein